MASKKVKAKTKDKKPKALVKSKLTADTANIFTQVKKAAQTADGFDNFVSRLGLNNDNALSAGTYDFNLVTRNRILLEAAYRGSWVVGAIVDDIADDMTRAGIDITTAKGKENLKELKNAMSRLQIWQSLCSTIKWGRLYGGALGVIQIKGQKLDTPLDLDTVSKDQFQGIVVYDRWQLNPVLTDVIDSGPEMGLPSKYQIVNNPTQLDPTSPTATGQTTVHHSRVIRFTGIDLPYFQAITEMMWGESVIERLFDRLISFDNTTMSSASLVDRANLRTIGIDGFREILAAGGEAKEGLISQFEMMRAFQVNEGLTLIDKNDEFASTAYSFAGLSDMLLMFGQQLSGAAGIPLVRLFGQSPAGLSATGEADIRMYYDNINADQEAKLRNPLEVILKVLWRSTFGTPSPDDLEFTFTPLWQTSTTEKVVNAKGTAETITGAFSEGLISRATAMKELRDAASEIGMFNNITDEEIEDAENEDPPPMPGDVPDDTEQTPLLPETGLNEEPRKPIGTKIKDWLKGKSNDNADKGSSKKKA